MSEAVSAVEAGPSAGALLRQAREASGLDVAILAGALKVPQRQLEALEEDRLDVLPDVVYARALAASVCRNLGVDPQVVLSRLPRGGDSRLGQSEPINVPFRAAGEHGAGPWRVLMSRPPVLAAVLLVVGAVVLLLLPLIPNRLPTTSTVTPVATQAPAVEKAAAPAGQVSEAVPAAAATAATPPAPTTAAPAAAETPPAAPAAVPVAASANATPAPAAPAAAKAAEASAASEGSLLEFHATKPTWVQVTDTRGSVYLRRMLSAGETVGVSGATPLSVVIGNAAGTQVQLRGKPYDLRQHVRGDNVARFEVR